jgi:hypothetical protein
MQVFANGFDRVELLLCFDSLGSCRHAQPVGCQGRDAAAAAPAEPEYAQGAEA